MAQIRQRPSMVNTPAELKLWRSGAAGATQSALAEVLGVSPRAVTGWEGGEFPMPPLLGWALLSAAKHVASLSLYRQRKLARQRKLKERSKREKLQRARAAAKRALLREAADEHRKELLQEHREARKLRATELRSLERAVVKLGPPDRIAKGESIFAVKVPGTAYRPKKCRNDVGYAHQWRGPPGKKLPVGERPV